MVVTHVESQIYSCNKKLKMWLYQPLALWKVVVLLLLVFVLLGYTLFLPEFCREQKGWMLFTNYFAQNENETQKLTLSDPQGTHAAFDEHYTSTEMGRSSNCLSRQEHSLFHKASARLGMPAELSFALAKYEEMHKRCSQDKNWTHAFSNPDPADTCDYLLYTEGPAGLGNRLLSLASAFLFAVLTNRVILVDRSGDIPELVCEPLSGSSWLLPADFPFEKLDHSVPKLREAYKEGWNDTKVIYLYLREDQNGDDRQFFCTATQQKLESIKWLAWNSNQYYIPRFFTLAPFWQQLVQLFPDVSLVFTHLSRYLFLPNNSIWDRIVRIHLSYFSSAQKRLGLQVRLHSRGDLSEFYPPAYTQIMNCLINNELLPNVSTTNSMAPSFNHKQQKPTERTTSVLVASLQFKYYEEIRILYMNNPAQDGKFVQVHSLSHEGREWHSLDQDIKAFIEMWLLSFSDEIATSSWSTFGYVAQGLGAITPHLLNIRGDFEKNGLPSCVVGQSIDPCNHFPFMNSCESESLSSEHSQWIQQHIKPCQDEGNGLQLVQSA
ncbi:hypothetical protein O6H91_18G042200 [Diphasiastrum complanatum]|uniref:Uncharacterized protein n=1 Tax=Diphasiastrum complanatum TaxID=34168 RepID=A0ACC2B1M5_DIPCM|nr:hypothetical protein O6H91_18G042200 [Diphasiastrum complanatum]